MKKLLLILALVPGSLFSQSRKEKKALEAQQKADQQVINSLKSHTQNLLAAAGDREKNAIDYISKQFAAAGLQPKGSDGFVQAFSIDDGKAIDPSTSLKINESLLEVNKDYFPLSYSAEKKVTGMPAMALRERGVPWFVDVKDWLEDGSTAVAKLDEAIKKEATKFAAKGATALFLYNSTSAADGIAFNNKDKGAPLPIPVVYITNGGYQKYFNDHSAMLDIELNIAFKEKKIAGTNVIGYMDNIAPTSIIVAAHYCRFVNDSSSKSADHNPVFTGANDNASGTAVLIELTRMLAASKAKKNNYLFISLGGNDEGIAASDYWLANTTVSSPVNYLINLDMVGNYGDGKNLLVQGYNSSASWGEVFTSIPDKKVEVMIDSVALPKEADASFYKKEIPVLTFSSAGHSDYATSADEESKINYAGELRVAKFITRLVEATDSRGKIAFAKVAQPVATFEKATSQVEVKPTTNTSPIASLRSTVSLGVIADRSNNETGLRISGVTPKKLAARIGLQPGDVLNSLGSYKISDFKSYLEALANFKAGDKTILRIKRGKDDKEFAVEF